MRRAISCNLRVIILLILDVLIIMIHCCSKSVTNCSLHTLYISFSTPVAFRKIWTCLLAVRLPCSISTLIKVTKLISVEVGLLSCITLLLKQY